MSAGLPGFGLGGLFFVACALLAPLWELAQTVRGRSSVRSWLSTLRQFTLALAMVGAFELTRRGVSYVTGDGGALGLRAIAMTAAVLVAVLIGAKLLELSRRTARAARRRARERRRYYPAGKLAPESEG